MQLEIENSKINSQFTLRDIGNIQKLNYNKKALNDILRNDTKFKNTFKPRIGGSSFSSGIFLDTECATKLWLGKCDRIAISNQDQRLNHKIIEAISCKEKISYDIYQYYGIKVPDAEISNQQMTNIEEQLQLFQYSENNNLY